MRVAILLPNLRGGGLERNALALASGLLRRGHEVDVVLKRFVCDYPEELPPGVRLFYLERPGGDERSAAGRGPLPVAPEPLFRGRYPFRVRYPRLSLAAAVSWSLFWVQLPKLSLFRSSPQWTAATAAYLDRERPDALLAADVDSVVAATMAALMARHRTRIVGSLHISARARSWTDKARWSYPRADAAVGVSRGVAAELTEVVGVPADRVHTIYDPVVSEGLVRAAERPAGHPWDRPARPASRPRGGPVDRAKGLPDPARRVREGSRPPAGAADRARQGSAAPGADGAGRGARGLPARGLSRIRGEPVRVHGEGGGVRSLFAVGRVGERLDPGDGLRLPGRQHRLPVRSGGNPGRWTVGRAGAGRRFTGAVGGDSPRPGPPAPARRPSGEGVGFRRRPGCRPL